jgi:protein-S-isoprenylcysteine O-methyltransferase Ste14
MNLETLFRALYLSWSCAEILIAAVIRTRRSSGVIQDHGSQFVGWTLGIVALSSADRIKHIAPWNISDTGWLLPLSLVVLIAGIAIRAIAIITLGRAFSANVAIRDAQKLKRDGLYRYVRHPSYLGIEVAFLAIALNSGNWACFAWIFLLPTAGLLYRIQVEERALRTAFGEDYAAYCRTTKRLIPGLFLFVICATSSLTGAAVAQDHVGNALGGKAQVELLHRYEGAEMLPKPTRVVIQDFAYTPPAVTDETTSPRHHHHESDAAPIPEELVQQLRDGFAKTAIGQFKKMNLETDRVSDASVVMGPALVVEGEFNSIVPGSSRKRIIVGFGRGASDVKTHLIISEVVDGQKTVLLDCNIDSKSGKKPGAILSTSGTGFAIGVATGHFGDKMSSTVKADASRMAKLVVKQTKAIMVAQKWTSKPAHK